MTLGTLITGAVLSAIVALVIVSLIKEKKKGNSSCHCGCSGCALSGKCTRRK